MSGTPFAPLMQRTNLTVIGRLANAVGNIERDGVGVGAVSGLFDANYVKLDVGVIGAASAKPAFTVRDEALPEQWRADPVGALVVLQDVGAFIVAEAEADGAGTTVLLLEKLP